MSLDISSMNTGEKLGGVKPDECGTIEKMLYNKKYAIITHRLFTGAGQDLYRFLKKNNARYVLLVQHSFSSAPDRRTTFTESDK